MDETSDLASEDCSGDTCGTEVTTDLDDDLIEEDGAGKVPDEAVLDGDTLGAGTKLGVTDQDESTRLVPTPAAVENHSEERVSDELSHGSLLQLKVEADTLYDELETIGNDVTEEDTGPSESADGDLEEALRETLMELDDKALS